MNEYEKFMEQVEKMREEGYAITIFTPEELKNVPPQKVENVMVERGFDAIDDLKSSY